MLGRKKFFDHCDVCKKVTLHQKEKLCTECGVGLISIRKYKAGYVVKKRICDGKEYHCKNFKMEDAYNFDGQYIGNTKDARTLCRKYGIKPELADPSDNTCSIGFSEKHQKWYGWSHRAIYGFGIGYITTENSICCESGYTPEYLKEHPEEDRRVPVGFEVKTLEDAKKCAIAFAESVS